MTYKFDHGKMVSATLNIVAKLLNISSNQDIDMENARSQIYDQIIESYRGKLKNGVDFFVDFNLSVVKSMKEVDETDHLFVLADLKGFNGGANQLGGKVAFMDKDYFSGIWDMTMGNTGERTAAHEFGHLLGLRHSKNSRDLMKQGSGTTWYSFATKIDAVQREKIIESYKTNKLNQGFNYEDVKRGNYSRSGWTTEIKPNRGFLNYLIKY